MIPIQIRIGKQLGKKGVSLNEEVVHGPKVADNIQLSGSKVRPEIIYKLMNMFDDIGRVIGWRRSGRFGEGR